MSEPYEFTVSGTGWVEDGEKAKRTLDRTYWCPLYDDSFSFTKAKINEAISIALYPSKREFREITGSDNLIKRRITVTVKVEDV